MSIVIVGAGPNLGMAIARRFGREGLAVGLIARTQDKLDGLVAKASRPAWASTSDEPPLRWIAGEISRRPGSCVRTCAALRTAHDAA